MGNRRSSVVILMADDDQDDCLLVREALAESRLADHLICVEDGEQLMDYLHRRGKYEDPSVSPWPDLILLDLNMPKKDGLEALVEIRSDPDLKRIPIVVLTTSREEKDVLSSYNLGANSFIIKPVTFERLVEVMKSIGTYWLEIVELPNTEGT